MASRGGGMMEQILRGAPPAGAAQPAPDPQQGEPGDGTQQSGYVTPDLGPFECENCIHFHENEPQFPKNCDHPEVINDQEIRAVEAEGCCNFFKSAGAETQQQEHSEEEGSEEG